MLHVLLHTWRIHGTFQSKVFDLTHACFKGRADQEKHYYTDTLRHKSECWEVFLVIAHSGNCRHVPHVLQFYFCMLGGVVLRRLVHLFAIYGWRCC